MKTIIIGGVAGGMSCATRLRRLDESADIVVIERSGYVSYANCGLPYYVGGVIEERDALLLQTPESLAARFALDVRVHHEVSAIDAGTKTVTIRNRITDNVWQEPYDNLVLSTGASPFVPTFPGSERALTLRNVHDTDAMAAAAEKATSAVVIGAGFVGLEVAENLRHRGLEVTVVELATQVLPPLDPELAVLIENELRRNGVAVHTGTSVADYRAGVATLVNGEQVKAELLVAAVGVRPDSSLASHAGLEVTDRGLIVVDESLRTSDPSIFAVGDAIAKRDAITGAAIPSFLANSANRGGRRAADVIAGLTVRVPPVLNTAIVRVFDLVAAVTGANETRARAANLPVRIIHTHPTQHAGYYPGAESMHMKLVIDPITNAILGAQAVGKTGVDKRIDVIATAIRGGIGAIELMDLDLAYSPPFGSAKDPVNMLGYVAENLASGRDETVQWYEVDDLVTQGVQLIDVRSRDEHDHGAIPGAINIPIDELRGRLDEVAQVVIVHCEVGVRGHIAASILASSGKHVRNLDGGYLTWKALQAKAVAPAR